MSTLADIINAKNQSDHAWQQKRESDIADATAIRDSGIAVVSTDPDTYGAYLTLQGDNPMYSAGNIILCLYQLDSPTKVGTKQRWSSLGRRINADVEGHGAKIFTQGGQLGMAYDISQTDGREIAEPSLPDGTDRMVRALTTLMNYGPINPVNDTSLESVALFDENNKQLRVNPDAPQSEAFSAIAREVALYRMHSNMKNKSYYDRDQLYLDADSVSYILCRRFGVQRELPDASNIASLTAGLPLESMTKILDNVQDMAKHIGGGIEKAIDVQQRVQNQKPNRPRR